MEQLTPTHHRNYVEVKHKSTGRCTLFAPRHHDALFLNLYAYQRNTVIRNKTQLKFLPLCLCLSERFWVDYIWILCRLSAFFLFRSMFSPFQGPFKAFKHYTSTGADQNNCSAGPEKTATEAILTASGANQGAFLQLSWRKHLVADWTG